jgi:flagellar motor switch protein FliM
MKPERAIIAERTVAQHCGELLRAVPAPTDLSPAVVRLGERLTRTLGSALAPLSRGEAPLVRCAPVRECAMADLARETAPLAANGLLAAGAAGAPFLVSLDAEAVFRMVDRAFGGRGHVPAPLPGAFPLSAELMIARLEAMVGTAVALALEPAGDAVRTLRRDGDIRQLAPFPPHERLTVITLEISDGDGTAWSARLAFPQETLVALLGQGERPAPPRPEHRAPATPAQEPFCDLPLTIQAVLVDMRIPFSTLSALRPGQVLPVAVARSVPLRIGDKAIAHGTIGALDDRVAVQITQAF